MSAIWYIGPYGDLRAVPCPETGLSTTVVRYGGIRQSLSGARTMDITGYRRQYDFDFRNLEYDEVRWLEAMHLRLVPGPFRLMDPCRINRLTPESSFIRPALSTSTGIDLSSGTWYWVQDWPSGPYGGTQSLRWTSYSGSSTMKFDTRRGVTVFTAESVSFSIYLKGQSALSVTARLDWYDRLGALVSASTNATFSVTTSWTRFTINRTAPADAAYCVPTLTMPVTPVDLFSAAAMLNTGVTALTWEPGGASPVVLLDQLDTESPRFNLTNCSASFLEM